MKLDTYKNNLAAPEKAFNEIAQRFIDARTEALSEDEDELKAAMEEAEIDGEIGWQVFYHETMSVEELIDMIRPNLRAEDEKVAIEVFQETVKAQSPPPGLGHEVLHQRLSMALVRLIALKSAGILNGLAEVLLRYPDKTEHFCTYLIAIAPSHAEAVCSELQTVVASAVFRTDWQWAWLMRAIQSVATRIDKKHHHNRGRGEL